MRLISVERALTALAVSRQVAVTVATSLIIARACGSVSAKNSDAASSKSSEQVPSSRLMFVVNTRGLPRIYPAFGRHCYAYSRWKLSEPEREIVRKYRPDGARYRTFSDVKKQGAYANEIRETRIKEQRQLRDDGLALELNGGFWQPDVGALRRDGVQLVGLKSSIRGAAEFYPADTLMSQDKWPVEPRARAMAYEGLQSVQSVNVDIGNEQSRGFAYCYAEEFPLRDNFFAKTGTLPATATIDGTTSVTNADAHWRGFSSMPLYIFETDECVLEGMIFNLESTRGDV